MSKASPWGRFAEFFSEYAFNRSFAEKTLQYVYCHLALGASRGNLNEEKSIINFKDSVFQLLRSIDYFTDKDIQLIGRLQNLGEEVEDKNIKADIGQIIKKIHEQIYSAESQTSSHR